MCIWWLLKVYSCNQLCFWENQDLGIHSTFHTFLCTASLFNESIQHHCHKFLIRFIKWKKEDFLADLTVKTCLVSTSTWFNLQEENKNLFSHITLLHNHYKRSFWESHTSRCPELKYMFYSEFHGFNVTLIIIAEFSFVLINLLSLFEQEIKNEILRQLEIALKFKQYNWQCNHK